MVVVVFVVAVVVVAAVVVIDVCFVVHTNIRVQQQE